MSFQPTPLNVSNLLLIAFGALVIFMLAKEKHDTNLSLIFFGAMIAFVSFTNREIHPWLLYGGAALALVVRFEFMNKSFTKFFAVLLQLTIAAVIYVCLVEIFGPGMAIF